MNPLQRIKHNLATPFRETRSTMNKQWAFWLPVYQQTRQTLREQKDKNQQITEPENNANMLQMWGVEPEQRTAVIKGLIVEKWLYIGLAIALSITAVLTPFDPITRSLFLVLTPGFCIVALTKDWRVMCLQQQKFLAFKTWVMRGCP